MRAVHSFEMSDHLVAMSCRDPQDNKIILLLKYC